MIVNRTTLFLLLFIVSSVFLASRCNKDPVKPDPNGSNDPDPDSLTLSVLTYNLWYDQGNWQARLKYILQEIRKKDPDIIGLQEVIQRENLSNQASTIADSLGYYYYFSSVDPPDRLKRFGNAILSRYPFEEKNWRALEPRNDFRTAIYTRIHIHGYTLNIYNTHLHHTAEGFNIRRRQIYDMFSFMEQTRAAGLTVLTGDFNANPDWEEMQIVFEKFDDVYALFHEDHLSPGHSTLNYNLGHQKRRIDYVLVKTGDQAILKPVSAEIILDKLSDSGVWGSDHFGVFAVFTLRQSH